MAKFLNHYRCYKCQHEWEDEWTAMSDDECPECGARACTPYKSDELPYETVTLELRLKVKYDLNGESTERLKKLLSDIATIAIDDGRVSGDSDAEVEKSSIKVVEIKPRKRALKSK